MALPNAQIPYLPRDLTPGAAVLSWSVVVLLVGCVYREESKTRAGDQFAK